MKPYLSLLFLCLALPAAAKTIDSVEAKVLRVIDGDSIVVKADIWIKQTVETTVRIAGIDTPELKGKCATEKEKAVQARDYLKHLIDDSPRVMLRNVRTDKYGGRVVADVILADGSSVRDRLIQSDFARSYRGGKRQSWCGKK